MSCDGTRPEELATEFGISGKELRDWLREAYPRAEDEHGTDWHLTHDQVQRARRRFGPTS